MNNARCYTKGCLKHRLVEPEKKDADNKLYSDYCKDCGIHTTKACPEKHTFDRGFCIVCGQFNGTFA